MENKELNYLIQKAGELIGTDEEYWSIACIDIALDHVKWLREALNNAVPSLDLLQARLSKGCYIEHQDGLWWLFNGEAEFHGEGICSGKTIQEMLINLIFVDC